MRKEKFLHQMTHGKMQEMFFLDIWNFLYTYVRKQFIGHWSIWNKITVFPSQSLISNKCISLNVLLICQSICLSALFPLISDIWPVRTDGNNPFCIQTHSQLWLGNIMRLLLEWYFWLKALTCNRVVQNSYKIAPESKIILMTIGYF